MIRYKDKARDEGNGNVPKGGFLHPAEHPETITKAFTFYVISIVLLMGCWSIIGIIIEKKNNELAMSVWFLGTLIMIVILGTVLEYFEGEKK